VVSDTLITGAHVATVDGQGREYESGYVAVVDGRIAAVGSGAVPSEFAGLPSVDASGCLVTPGLVNTHHHLYQWGTRGYAQQDDLFGWLTTLYPVWAGIGEEIVSATSAAGLGMLALSGCTTAADHHYVVRPRAGTSSVRLSVRGNGSGFGCTRFAGRWISVSRRAGFRRTPSWRRPMPR
jgi:cytosine/adenosine deaminase-related metal-dependent hydrolase